MSTVLVAGILELDENLDVLMTVCHPSISDAELEVIKSRSGLVSGGSLTPFVCSRYKNQWHYIHSQDADSDSRLTLPGVTRFSAFVTAKDFCPEKYSELCKLFARAHTTTASCVSLMQIFVDVTIKGQFENEKIGSFREGGFDPRRSLIASPLKQFVEVFPDHFALIWLAMTLKRRIFVIGSSVPETMRFVRALPLFAWHRSNWSMLRPYVTSTQHEIEDLEQAGVYCAGVVGQDNSLINQVPHDLLVNIPEREVKVTETGKDLLGYCQAGYVAAVVKEVLEATGANNDQTVIKVLATKTKELIDKTKALKQQSEAFNLAALSTMDPPLPAHLPQLIYAVAAAEGIV